MNYKLAKQLKDAGFPQRLNMEIDGEGYDRCKEGRLIPGMVIDEKNAARVLKKGEDMGEIAYEPTLEELIEACGDEFDKLIKNYGEEENKLAKEIFGEDSDWIAYAYSLTASGKTPTEAVAKLWLKLNKK